MRRSFLFTLALALALVGRWGRVSASCTDDCSDVSSCTQNGTICASDSDCTTSCCCVTYSCGDSSVCEVSCSCS